ncbi:hypothetical protein FB45DRAFT_68258 [Roridomyces roridus]|uniref:Uncharacterized protein n=1 Tax=Roridomyces roridus TaxID=1738132 RepID=A0AAD7BN44_9AGAR|nr:hypothetical protein FB45DRAFT_68258 [Roridomyces roridus]
MSAIDRRPDRPLVVKCTFDRWNKRITFSSARNCSYDLLRHKVEQCFSLYATSYAIAYKDDDGEITDITTDTDLSEAIQYFHAGGDDPPMSSAASILSGRSFGSRKITLRVTISVDYDGPSLSDTSSLASLDEYKNRNGSQQSFSFGAPSVDLDDDSVTVSSRDAISRAERPVGSQASSSRSWDVLSEPQAGPSTSQHNHSNASDPFSDETHMPAQQPEEPTAVFERLKLQESIPDDSSSVQHGDLGDNDRGAAWLRDQNARTIRSMLGAMPAPSVSSGVTSFLEDDSDGLGGALELEQDTRGKYYYSYTAPSSSQNRESYPSSSSQNRDSYASSSRTRDSGYYADSGVPEDFLPQPKPRPSSRNLNWLAAQQAASASASSPQPSQKALTPPSSSSESSSASSVSSFQPEDHSSFSSIEPIPRELLQYLPLNPPDPQLLTDCSECGVLLDSIRYVCSICGEKKPVSCRAQNSKGKGQSVDSYIDHGPAGFHAHHHEHHYHHEHDFTYPPRPLGSLPSSSRTFLNGGSTDSLTGSMRSSKPLPRVPAHPGYAPPRGVFNSQTTLVVTPPPNDEQGYELCSGCIEIAGVTHAIEAGLQPGSGSPSPSASPSSPEGVEWRRLAPKKGQTRHAYREKVWSHLGWEDVEQDEGQIHQCSTCAAVTTHQRYKCASCKQFNLCRACYSQVHDLHPSHAFLVVPDCKPPGQNGMDEDVFETVPPDIGPAGEKSLTHPDVRCAHCLQDIVGARFHCAICDAVDICQNCESAGLPGNLDSSDGGHNSSHILIKIPYPLETDEVQTASRRAIHLWQGRDAASVGHQPPKPAKAASVVSSYARTVVSSGGPRSPSEKDHHLQCHGCGQNIVGVRYQCANCPSSPQGFSLCEHCEKDSYKMHDPMHVFFKLPRPVQKPLVWPYAFLPQLYKPPAGPPPGVDPPTFLASLEHPAVLCDRCMSGIPGVWYRCAYCAKDYCEACEAVDTHNDAHIFMVFKSPVSDSLDVWMRG